MTRYPILIGAVLVVALSGTVVLAYASPGMMGGTGRGGGMMRSGMGGCMGMMQGMRGGGSQPPNEQWR
jgi:hypothetical protein